MDFSSSPKLDLHFVPPHRGEADGSAGELWRVYCPDSLVSWLDMIVNRGAKNRVPFLYLAWIYIRFHAAIIRTVPFKARAFFGIIFAWPFIDASAAVAFEPDGEIKRVAFAINDQLTINFKMNATKLSNFSNVRARSCHYFCYRTLVATTSAYGSYLVRREPEKGGN